MTLAGTFWSYQATRATILRVAVPSLVAAVKRGDPEAQEGARNLQELLERQGLKSPSLFAPELKTMNDQYDDMNERCLLHAALAATEEGFAQLVPQVSSTDFINPQHRHIWNMLVELHNAGQWHRRAAALKDAEPTYLAELETLPVPRNTEWHVATLKWDAVRATILGKSSDLMVALKKPRTASDPDLRDAAKKLLLDLENAGFGWGPRPPKK